MYLFPLKISTFVALPLGARQSCPNFEFSHLSGVISLLRSDALRLNETRMMCLLIVSPNSHEEADKG